MGNALIETIDHLAEARATHVRATLERQLRQAEDTNRRQTASKRTGWRDWCIARRTRRLRITQAVQTIIMLCAVGRSESFQKILELSGGEDIRIFGGHKVVSPGYDMSDVHWTYETAIVLGKNRLRLYNKSVVDTFDMSVSYGSLMDPFILAGPLWAISTSQVWEEVTRAQWRAEDSYYHGMDEEEILEAPNYGRQACFDLIRPNHHDFYAPELLFEVLVECSDQEVLAKLLAQGL